MYKFVRHAAASWYSANVHGCLTSVAYNYIMYNPYMLCSASLLPPKVFKVIEWQSLSSSIASH